MSRLTIDEVIQIVKAECEEQKDTIKYLEGQEEQKHYIQFHEKVVNECEHIVEYLTELKQYKNKEEQGLLIPCKVGDTVYLRACCECVCMSEDYETGIKECPFENECEFEECENGNEKIFKTSITNIWNDGRGWYFLVRGLDIEIPVRDIGTSVFFTEEALENMGGK